MKEYTWHQELRCVSWVHSSSCSHHSLPAQLCCSLIPFLKNRGLDVFVDPGAEEGPSLFSAV